MQDWIDLAAAARLVPTKGQCGHSHVSRETVYGWITRGLQAANGRRVTLSGVRFGRQWYTTSENVRTFIQALTAVEGCPNVEPAHTTDQGESLHGS